MDKSNVYQLYTSKTIGKIPCVEIQLGKQKKKKYRDTSIFFSQIAFQTLEETIWDNYREYSSNSTVKIEVQEWVKIIKGFSELSELLQTTDYNIDLLGLLGYKSVLEKDEYRNNFLQINLEISKMLTDFIAWIKPELDKNEYITICG